ncbi:MAG: HPF/RaiA family ribosome-associated protein [Paramuribaculum sp.]|nr:HPF/RaiA family ribosome-associated protein [Paramuribaculum sp.]MDE6323019.1 HPF/RaiA family ribosome-associated protein [Paramuribaculum sp.]MDE6488520.1 HPF/RaiA family ribosome-associated protein [Paramuribaculum sp.]
MEVRIQGIHFDVTEQLTQFINKKADKLTRRYPSIDYIEAVLTVLKPETSMNKQARLKVIVPHEAEQVATKVADSFEEAVDLCLEAVERQLEKAKAKK